MVVGIPFNSEDERNNGDYKLQEKEVYGFLF